MKTYLREIRQAIRSQLPITGDNSVVNSGDDSVVKPASAPLTTDHRPLATECDDSVVKGSELSKVQGGDDSVVNKCKWLEEDKDNFHSLLWKSLWKSPHSGPQTTEIYGLLADCTKFVQSFVTCSTSIIVLLTGKNLKIFGIFCRIPPPVAGFC